MTNNQSTFPETTMEHDCGFAKENHRFRYRTGAILIHDDKMLFVKSSFGTYYYMLGGGVHLGETSEKCMEREIFEETGIHAHIDQLAVVCETFFKDTDERFRNADCHNIEFYYRMKATDRELALCKDRTDEGEELVWLPIAQISQYNIKPSFIKNHIQEIIHQKHIIHVIEEIDR
jgi:8-oxo-dGTP pyrophosphatase MutT (NUDIX family)